MFQVTTSVETVAPLEGDEGQFSYRIKDADPANDFFGKPAFLTVSGQLEAETLALGMTNVYTFGPTFRAENSNSSRHLAEFWMVEPEMAFCDLEGDMNLAEEFLKEVIGHVLDQLRRRPRVLQPARRARRSWRPWSTSSPPPSSA